MHKITQHIVDSWSHLKEKVIYVACSGGLDSLCLLHALHKLEYNVNCVHVNYQFRAQDSEDDALFVERFCAEHSIPFQIRVATELKQQLSSGGNLQQLARDFRYDWFNELKAKCESNYIALAHHSDDQMETFFLNVARKSGIMGMSCMLDEKNRTIRPFLKLDKVDLLDYAEFNAIEWREDVSNASNKYRRNAIRNEFLPFLEDEIPSLKSSVLYLITQFQNEQARLEDCITPLINRIEKSSQLTITEYDALALTEKVEFFRQIGQSATIVAEVDKLASAQKGKKVKFVSHLHNPFTSVVKEMDALTFVQSELMDKIPTLIIESTETLPNVFSKGEVYLEADKIQGDLKLRKWQEGDRIHPIGISGSKLISDIIAEAKIPAHEKQAILVLVDDKNIHWCVGLKIGRKAIATPLSKKIQKCSISAPLK